MKKVLKERYISPVLRHEIIDYLRLILQYNVIMVYQKIIF